MNYVVTKTKKFFKDYLGFNVLSIEEVPNLPNVVGFDLEMTSLYHWDGEVFCIQVGTGKDNYIFDIDSKRKDHYTFEDVIPLLEGKTLVGHNLTFDLKWCYKHGFYPKKVHDTFIASKLLYNGKPPHFRHGLGHVLERELKVKIPKDDQKIISKVRLTRRSTVEYSFNDVDKIIKLMNVLGTKLKRQGMSSVYHLHREYIKALAYMEFCGIPIDEWMWQEKMVEDKRLTAIAAQKVKDYVWDNLPEFRDGQLSLFDDNSIKRILPELGSPKQMIPVFEALGINTVSDKDSDKKSIEEAVIKKTKHDFVDIWLDYQSINHDVTTYGQNVLDQVVGGRIYSTFNPILDTGRISTRKEGINILNLPANKKTRHCFQAKKGYTMVVADYEGQENVVGADYHQDPEMVRVVQEGSDLHSGMVRVIHPELATATDEEIKTRHKDKRNAYKSVRFAAAYGGTGYTIAVNMNIPVELGEQYYDAYKQLHAGIFEWLEDFMPEVIEKGYIESYLGFRLYLPFYEEFLETRDWISNLPKDFWTRFNGGRNIFYKKKEATENEEELVLTPEQESNLKFYYKYKDKVTFYNKLQGRYKRLCLNNPVQASSAMITKKAVVLLFNKITEKDLLGKVKICNVPHDEIVLEVPEEIGQEWCQILEECMITAGNSLLRHDNLQFKAEAFAGDSWYTAKTA